MFVKKKMIAVFIIFLEIFWSIILKSRLFLITKLIRDDKHVYVLLEISFDLDLNSFDKDLVKG
jgi:hypothetical protein